MSARVPREGYGPTRLLLVFGLVLLGHVGVGRLAMEAWLVRSAPESLPSFGARTDEASPFLMVIIDGLREPSAWATDDPPMPWFQSFAKRGAYGTAIAGEPTLTAPCVRALLTGRRPDPLVAVKRFAKKVAVPANKVLAEAVEAAQVFALFWCFPTGDQHPIMGIRMEVVA